MTIKEAVNYVSYFMDTHEAKGEFSEAWSVIFKALEESTNSSHNSAMLEIALCLQRVFTIVNQGAMGKFCDLESDINAVVAQLQQ